MANILFVDDDQGIRDIFTTVLKKDGHNVVETATGLKAVEAVQQNPFDVILLDLRLPDMDGAEVLKKIKQLNPNATVIIISGFSTMDSVVKTMKEGAYDFLPKPLDPECLKMVISRAMQLKSMITELNYLKEEMKPQINIVGNTPKMQEVFKTIGKVANDKITVLIEGESGTGKELVAHAIHLNSNRSERLFVAVDCSTIPSTLMEGELFGYEKGAFTGAVSRKIGRFEQADKGTIFLDEISNINLDTQAKFLRVIQEGEFQRIGAPQTTKVDVRIIAATNMDLEKSIQKGLFREDLYHRLNVVKIKIPSLRERKEDIPLLAEHLINKFAKESNTHPKQISKDAIDLLLGYDWPGNIRELENVLHQAVVTGRNSIIAPEDINLKTREEHLSLEQLETKGLSLNEVIESMEKRYITEALTKANNNCTQAAKILKIDRKVLAYKIKKYEISVEE
jgi:DNA-binding NtrC family response regulator